MGACPQKESMRSHGAWLVRTATEDSREPALPTLRLPVPPGIPPLAHPYHGALHCEALIRAMLFGLSVSKLVSYINLFSF